MRRIATLFLIVCGLSAPALAQQANGTGPSTIATRGEAVIKRAPDQAWVSIAAEARAATPAEAQRTAAESMRAVQAALSRAGVSGSAIRTSGYTLQPDLEYNNGRSRVRGYIVRNQIEVRVDDLDKLAGVLDAAGASGATSMAGLRFDIRDRASVEREALKLAVEDAMERAKALADGAREQLGAILKIEDQGDVRGPQPMYRMTLQTAAAGETPVNPGELEVHASVMLTVAIR